MNLNFLRVFSTMQLITGTVVILVVVVFLSVIFFSIVSKKEAPPQSIPTSETFPSLPSSKGPPVVIENVDPKSQKTFSNYLEVEVGKTTNDEISRLPNALKKEVLSDGRVLYEFKSNDPLRNNQIITKNGLVVFKTNVSMTEGDYNTPKFSAYKKRYGESEKEYTGSARYGEYIKTYYYGSKGFALIVNPYTDEVFEIQSFLPTSADNYLANWGQDITGFVKPTQKSEY